MRKLPERPYYRLFISIQVINLYALVVMKFISPPKGNHQGSNPVRPEKAGQVPRLGGRATYPGRIDTGYQTDFHLLFCLISRYGRLPHIFKAGEEFFFGIKLK